ncbi:MAG: hypothetical protein ACE5LU_04335 [Anaerolineae bacterium]
MPHIEVDQSGRIEVLTVDTAFGFSNDRQAAILIPAAVKRNCSRELHAGGVRPKLVSIRMFAGGIFLLVEGDLNHMAKSVEHRERTRWPGALTVESVRQRKG